MSYRLIITKTNLVFMYIAGMVALIAQKWAVAGVVLLAAGILTLLLIPVERWDRKRQDNWFFAKAGEGVPSGPVKRR